MEVYSYLNLVSWGGGWTLRLAPIVAKGSGRLLSSCLSAILQEAGMSWIGEGFKMVRSKGQGPSSEEEVVSCSLESWPHTISFTQIACTHFILSEQHRPEMPNGNAFHDTQVTRPLASNKYVIACNSWICLLWQKLPICKACKHAEAQANSCPQSSSSSEAMARIGKLCATCR